MSKKEGAVAEEKAEQAEAKAEHEAKKQKKSFAGLCCKNMALTVIVVLVVGLIAGTLIGYSAAPKTTGPAPSPATGTDVNALKLKVQDYLNKNFLSSQGAQAEITSVESFSGNLYSMKFDIVKDGDVQQSAEVFLTNDGSVMVIGQKNYNVFLLNEPVPQAEPQPEPVPQEFQKSDKPSVELFVWSFCPGGVAGESALKPVVDLLGSKIDAKVVFIGAVTTDPAAAASSCFAGQGKSESEGLANCCVTYQNIEGKTVYSCALHNNATNQQESHESGRQACIQKYNPDKFWKYVEAFNANCIGKDVATCWKSQATTLGIDAAKIEQCAENAEGIKMLMADSDRSDELDIHSSPSLVINGTVYSGGTSAALYKEAICSAFNTAPSECSQEVTASSNPASNATCG